VASAFAVGTKPDRSSAQAKTASLPVRDETYQRFPRGGPWGVVDADQPLQNLISEMCPKDMRTPLVMVTIGPSSFAGFLTLVRRNAKAAGDFASTDLYRGPTDDSAITEATEKETRAFWGKALAPTGERLSPECAACQEQEAGRLEQAGGA
jgi:hypothetical protein